MHDFDTASYLKAVLAPFSSSQVGPDMFARYCLDPAEYAAGSDQLIEGRLVEVRAHWDKLQARNNVKYEELLKRLIQEHSIAKLTLLDGAERRRAAEAIRSEQTQRDEGRRRQEAQFEQRLTEVLSRERGLTSRNRRILEEYARHLELDPTIVSARLERCPTVSEHTQADALPRNVREAIRKALSSYAAAAGNPARGISLFHALGFTEPEYDRTRLKESCDRLGGELRRLKPNDPLNTPLKAILGFAKVHLLEGDPRSYMAALVLDVREALRPMAAGHAIDDDAIDELEAEQLVRAAQERGLPVQEARDLVADLAGDLNVRLLMGSAVDYISCPNCNRPHPSVGAPERCTRCGEALFRICPECQARCPAGDSACSTCGTDLAGYARAQRTLSDARLAVESGALSLAAELLAQLTVTPSDEDGKAFVEQVLRRLGSAHSEWQVIERSVSERRLYAAMLQMTQLERHASDVIGPAGATPAERIATLAERLREVESILVRARGESEAAREQSFTAALERAVDCREATDGLARIPPLAVSELRASDDGDQVRVEWAASPSPGPTIYRVLRCSARVDSSVELAVTETTMIPDTKAPAGEVLRYGVETERAGARSEVIWSDPVLLAREVQGLSVIEREGEIVLSWEPVLSSARVEVERREVRGGLSVQIQPERGGFVDRDVQNGTDYSYRVRVVYSGAEGHPVRTDGSVAFATPAQRPEPVIDLTATMEGDRVRFRFSTPERGTVSILRCLEPTGLEDGQELNERDFETFGESIPQDGNGFYDPQPAVAAWYLPVSRSGTYLLAGRAIRHLGLPPIVDVSAVDLGRSVRVTWSWPERTRAAILVWRRDRQPIDSQDDNAQTLTVTKAQYAEEGGVELSTPGPESVFLAVFPATRIDGVLLGASDTDRRARTSIRKVAKVEVGYAIRRSGLRKRQLLLEILQPTEALPELVVVAKQGELLPRTSTDGRVIAHLGGQTGARQQGFDLGELGRPVAVRLFFQSRASDSTHTLRDPNTQELVFR